ncbi:hypothetical protein PVT71_26205 (plasmid) [Salipiger sp. H15]|uniref:Major facilitator superfamily (MFS) profile domain-containing protein n=1 Tax=Alloyangia sp. H15 TaxID=3029062 RepID=A0AAU8ARJ5_9RHOB
MIVLDLPAVASALRGLQAELGVSVTGLSRVPSIQTLFFGGKFGDAFGRRRMEVIGLAIFALAVGTAQGAGFIVAVRRAGDGQRYPSALDACAPAGHLAHAVAQYSGAVGVSATIGTMLGGLLEDLISWRARFFLNLPVSLGLLRSPSASSKRPRLSADASILAAPRFPLSGPEGFSSLQYTPPRPAGATGDPSGWCWRALLIRAFLLLETRVCEPCCRCAC